VTPKPLPPPSSRLLLFPESDTEYVHFENAHQHPFDHTARDFSRVNAWWLADAALLAYWDEGRAQRIWENAGLRFAFLSRDGSQCHIGWTDAFVIVAFRGTQPDDWRDLFDIARVKRAPWAFGGKVHRGFLDAHTRIWDVVKKKLEDLKLTSRPTWFTGHSLGGALATLSMDHWGSARGLYTIGCPPVGNRRFARGFNTRHAGRCFRYVNHRDIVVHVAAVLRVILGHYAHIKEQKYIDAKGEISRSSMPVRDWLSLLVASLPRVAGDDPANLFPLLPGFLVDHTPRRYAVHIWNDLVRSPSPLGAPTTA
jgi:triacylglycerol lipase